jgi:hypothetical protein
MNRSKRLDNPFLLIVDAIDSAGFFLNHDRILGSIPLDPIETHAKMQSLPSARTGVEAVRRWR